MKKLLGMLLLMCSLSVAKIGFSDFKSIGYISSWGDFANINKLNYNNLTHVIYAFAIPNPDGSGDFLPLEGAADRVPALKANTSAKGVKMMLGVGGWSANGDVLWPTMNAATSTPAKRTQFVRSILKIVRDNGFDGVDMDWETPEYGDAQAQFNQVMLELHDSLAPQGKLLFASMFASSAGLMTNEVINAVDVIMPMVYWNGVDKWMPSFANRIPKQKLALGIVFHGFPEGDHGWKSYADLLKAGASPYDSVFGGTPYAGMNQIVNTWIPAAWKYANGVLIWELNQDYYGDSTFSLLKAVGDGIRTLDPLWRESITPWVRIKNVGTGKYMRDRGANVLGLDDLNESNASYDSTTWWKPGLVGVDIYKFQNKKTGKVIDVVGANMDIGSYLGTWTYGNGENQKSTVERLWNNVETRGYYLRQYVFHSALKILDFRSSDGKAIVNSFNYYSPTQKWAFERAKATQAAWVSPYVSSSSSSATGPVNCASMARWDANTPWTDYAAGAYRQHNGYAWVVTSPGYAIYEPGSAFGVYGWAQKGPCQ